MSRNTESRWAFLLQSLRRDLFLIGRDGLLVMLLSAPILAAVAMGVFWRLGVPALKPLFDLTPYLSLVHVFLVLLPAIMMGMIFAFILLEEKEQGLDPVWRLAGYAFGSVFAVRVVIPVLVNALITVVALFAFNLVQKEGWILPVNGVLVLFAGTEVPIFALFLSAIAANRVQGLALGKLISIFELAPIAAVLCPGRLRVAVSWLPPFWLGWIGEYGSGFVPAAIVHAVWIAVLYGTYRYRPVMV